MNQFDEFIDETDKKLNIDTSTQISVSNSHQDDDLPKVDSVLSSPKSPIINNTSKFNLQRQKTPTGIVDHPLKNSGSIPDKELDLKLIANKDVVPEQIPTTGPLETVPVTRSVIPKRRSVMLNKRRSLIQPVMAPISPENFINKSGVLEDNILKPSDDVPARKYSIGNSNIIDPEHVQLSVHSRSSSLTSSSTNLDTTDINTLLKSLASKEMDLFESKQKIEDLRKQLSQQQKMYDQHAKELQQLKTQVTKHLSENVNVAGSTISSPVNVPQIQKPPIDSSSVQQPIPSNTTNPTSPKLEKDNINGLYRRGTRTLRPKKNGTPSINKTKEIPISPESIAEPQPSEQEEESTWNKPFAMFNQFDQILQNELEKSLNWDSETDNDSPEKLDRFRGANVFNPTNTVSEDTSSSANPSLSKSLWSFVDTVRSGLLGIDENEEYENENISKKVASPNERGYSNQSSNSTMKQFKTAQKSQGNKLQFIGDIKDNNQESIRRNVEMKDF
ncbi:similar to Saccharomyces cerevisiae YHR159W TDA11 Putative protein of unknown function [Maudiozyma barnettii]|uniref:Topoisomerase I damage affected protein 11 n=1 Tax=Maudiozyma barnettii TaxID=61262 RepID=A0A8H2ZIF3_9SACH|nr:Tda11p [Kazachstania barnettii]CAB4254883.1 similar to Saccharomyces cerevisiae YHR159W TDA11 Putative protein of unknown function [Kazachstania barnettii]CAD1783127.1 similar to Saccharomyces cerevisiae YHR159W TDA11 Putative protein of unknown function [Kazachstania barnettii]